MSTYIMVNDQAYSLDTTEQISEARVALRDAGLGDAHVWAGVPDGLGDSYPIGQVLRPAEPEICECGEVYDEPCAHELDDEAVTVEWMPEHHRASHEAAGNAGSWPHNGARRLRCAPSCAREIVESDPEWASVVEAD